MKATALAEHGTAGRWLFLSRTATTREHLQFISILFWHESLKIIIIIIIIDICREGTCLPGTKVSV